MARIQGTPTSVNIYNYSNEEVWGYGSSGLARVTFNLATGRVIKWDDYGGVLKVTVIPGPNVTQAAQFTFGSHKDDVARVQGTPTSVNIYNYSNEEVWGYGSSGLARVTFNLATGLVTKWDDYGGTLKVKT